LSSAPIVLEEFPRMPMSSLGKILRSWKQSCKGWHPKMDKLSSFFKFYVDVLQLYFRLRVPRKFIDLKNDGHTS
jgi:hypothetical protein